MFRFHPKGRLSFGGLHYGARPVKCSCRPTPTHVSTDFPFGTSLVNNEQTNRQTPQQTDKQINKQIRKSSLATNTPLYLLWSLSGRGGLGNICCCTHTFHSPWFLVPFKGVHLSQHPQCYLNTSVFAVYLF